MVLLVDELCDVILFYMDVEIYVIDDVIILGVVCYDNYKGFGDIVNFKLVGNWLIIEDVFLCGVLSIGFRVFLM